jgi:hypothetical protein
VFSDLWLEGEWGLGVMGGVEEVGVFVVGDGVDGGSG